jgi:hypothetical protein
MIIICSSKRCTMFARLLVYEYLLVPEMKWNPRLAQIFPNYPYGVN